MVNAWHQPQAAATRPRTIAAVIFFPTAPSVTEVPCVSVGQTQTWGSFTAGPCLSAARAAQECHGLVEPPRPSAVAADGMAKPQGVSPTSCGRGELTSMSAQALSATMS